MLLVFPFYPDKKTSDSSIVLLVGQAVDRYMIDCLSDSHASCVPSLLPVCLPVYILSFVGISVSHIAPLYVLLFLLVLRRVACV